MAIATVLFPTLARFANAGEIDNLRATMANGMRQILFVLVPAAAAILALSDPMIRLVYQRGAFDAGTKPRSSPRRSSGSPSRCRPTASTCCRRGPSSACSGPGRRPALAAIDLVVSAAGGAGPLQAVRGRRDRRRDRDRHRRRVVAQAVILRREFGGLELGRLLSAAAPDHDRRGGAGGGRAGWSGTCSTRRSAAASWARSSPWARAGARRPASTSAVAKLLRVAELEQMSRLLRRRAASGGCSGPGGTCWAWSRSAAGRVRLAGRGGAARLVAAAVRGGAGAPGDGGDRAGAADLVRRSCSGASGSGTRCRIWCSSRRSGLGCGSSAPRSAGGRVVRTLLCR